ncbi:MAG: pilus assembly protein PilM [Planctomycetes bacterium]|nr:pilus assembly protein PilM [Planctomycetota bacterium]
MVKSIGIDPGDHAIKVVELDGSYKKPRLVRVHAAPAAAESGPRPDAVAAVARAAIDLGMRGDVVLGHACREAVLRIIELPFKGYDAIKKVVKNEIEGEIYSQAVDDRVVDFLEIGAGHEGGTRVLVAAVPKPPLRAQLASLSAQKIEPETVELDTLALWRAAHWAGAFAGADGAVDPAAVTAVVDLGARSVKVLLVEGERLIEMRALRLGAAAVADELAQRHRLDAATARDAVQRCLDSGADQRFEVPDGLPVATGDGQPAAAPPTREVVISHGDVDSAQTAYLQRLARELTRFLTASGKAAALRAVWVTGGACRLAGVRDMLAAVFGMEVKELDLLSRLNHDLDGDEVERLGPTLTTAIGLALLPMGGPDGFQLRQEDLLLARGFERIKFPLAIACMVGLLAMLVFVQKRTFELRLLERQIGATWRDPKDPKAPPQFFGMLNSVLSGKWFEDAQHFRLQAKGKDYTYKDLLAELDAAPVARRVQIVRDQLKKVADQKQEDSGVYEDVSLESGLAVMVRFSEVLRSCDAELGRYLLPKISLQMAGRSPTLDFTVAFREEGFRSRQTALQRAFERDIGKPDSPFAEVKSAKEDPFKDVNSGGSPGAYYTFSIGLKDSFPPFGPSAQR